LSTSRFFAHSLPDQDEAAWHRLVDHLTASAALAEQFAAPFAPGNLAYLAALLHDVGKYTDRFQRRLRGDPVGVDHSTWGARIATERFSAPGWLLAYAIAGHHAGLANGRDDGARSCLQARLKADLEPLLPDWERELDVPARAEFPPHFVPNEPTRFFQLAFLTRMIFSCLVDADFLDTEAFFAEAERQPVPRSGDTPTLAQLREKLDERLSAFSADTAVNQKRQEILRHVRIEASQPPGMFSLTVPTGGGKTLASMAFALDHALAHGLRRVIYVIPFTSIVEQNAAVFRDAFGELGDAAVLEHHSAFIDDPKNAPQAREKLKLAMENWDAPVVVTTSVQFFESLFANRPSRCRKLHNIAGSVVIFDEAQTLPLSVMRPAVAALDELARNYRTSIVLCTATQPALNAPDFKEGFEQVRELAPDPKLLATALKRVQVRHVGQCDDEQLVAHLRTRDQVLCIINNRRHARALFEAIADLPGARHLSTLMCAKHRSVALAEIRAMLAAGQPCRLVSTSLIEAGVDVDFPAVLRAESGLDSIAQAAGRCNREGRRPLAESEVLIFEPANDEYAPPPELKQFAGAAREILRHYADDPLAPAAIESYFRLLYWQKGEEQLDAGNLLGQLATSGVDALPFEMLADRFRMIETAQLPVIVPFDDEAREALEGLRYAERVGRLARRLQPYIVQLPRQAFEVLRANGAVQPVGPDKYGEQFMELVWWPHAYDPRFGLSWNEAVFNKNEAFLW
jgi:CRISPR-associated endonuclease/helicase Cas3